MNPLELDLPEGYRIQEVYPGLFIGVVKGRVAFGIRATPLCYLIDEYEPIEAELKAYLERVLWI